MAAYHRVGTLLALKRELVNRGEATPATAEAVARRYVVECGCEVVTLDKHDGLGPVAWIVSTRTVAPIHRERPAPRKRKVS